MSAVWRASRAAVRRRRFQTSVIALVALCASATVILAAGLLDLSSGPFERAFAAQRGPHVIATYSTPAPPTDATDTEAVAGPYGQLVLDVPAGGGPVWATGPLTVVGRADPAGPVDRVDLWAGRWATDPDEIVVNLLPPSSPSAADNFTQDIIGKKITTPGRPQLTIVGVAYSVSHTADAWVSPATMAQLGPTTAQVLYRFRDAATTAQVAAATASLPRDGLLAASSYLTQKEAVAAGPGTILPFLIVFGVLGLIVAVLIVANVISGAVVSGFRHIGVLKALGFTPRQVVSVYLVMVTVPATAGAAAGAVLGTVATRPLIGIAFQGLGFGGQLETGAWVPLTGFLGVPALVMLTALVPASRARRLSAAEAINASAAPKIERGLRVQRALSGVRLPRAVSLGLGLPFSRPGRTGLTMAALLLGVTSVTFAGGLAASLVRYGQAVDRADAVQVQVRPNNPSLGNPPTDRTDPQVESLLRGLPGTSHVTAELPMQLTALGHRDPVPVNFLRGDSATLGHQDQLVEGRWMTAPNEVVASSAALHHLGAQVGDRLELAYAGGHEPVTIVGKTIEGAFDRDTIFADWQLRTRLAPDHQVVSHEVLYYIRLASDTPVATYLAAVRQADPGLSAWSADSGLGNSFTVSVTIISIAFVSIIGLVVALSVFNTVLLNTRERRRDLGMLKAIGMTPGQVVTMMVTSMATLGLAAGCLGIPLGVGAHRLVLPLMAEAAELDLPARITNVWTVGGLSLVVLVGVAIAVLGAALPARRAGRIPIATVLHSE